MSNNEYLSIRKAISVTAAQNRINDRKWLFLCQPVLFFIFFYLYLWLWIEPRLIYHAFGVYLNFPVFAKDWLFLKESLSYPGGPIHYLSGFLSNWYYFSSTGALIITLIAWCIWRCTDILITLTGAPRWRIISYLPAILLLIINGIYIYPLTTILALLASLFLAIIYEKLSMSDTLRRTVLFLVMFVILYYIAAGASLIFACLAGIYEIVVYRRWFSGVLSLVFGLALIWLMGVYIFNLEIPNAYLSLLPFQNAVNETDAMVWGRIYLECLYLFFPTVILTVALCRNLFRKKRILQTKKNWITQTCALACAVLLAIFFSFDTNKKKLLEVNYFCRFQMWNRAVDTIRKIPLKFYNIYCNHDVNRALYYAGLLGDRMFSFPQDPSALLLFTSDSRHSYIRFMKISDISIDIGNVNFFEIKAHELLEAQGYNPYILMKLAMVNIAKGQTESAMIFLNSLAKDLIYGPVAQDFLQNLKSHRPITNDEITYLRSIMLADDRAYIHTLEDEHLLQALLKRNPKNKMAFEYLMAHYMLTGKLEKFVENIIRLEEFGYNRIPRHYEEAILLYRGNTGKQVDLHNRKISAESIKRYNKFGSLYQQFGNNKPGLKKAMLSEGLNNTYFYYGLFFSPK